MNDQQFKVLNEFGEEVICDILFTFDSDDTHKSYIVYTDNTRDESGNTNVMASTYDPAHQSPKLEPIETDAEWKMIETILSTLMEQAQQNQGKSMEEIKEALYSQETVDKLDAALGYAEEKEEMKFCRNCGNKLPASANFCDKCGEYLNY